jgi:hypothetical protein
MNQFTRGLKRKKKLGTNMMCIYFIIKYNIELIFANTSIIEY